MPKGSKLKQWQLLLNRIERLSQQGYQPLRTFEYNKLTEKQITNLRRNELKQYFEKPPQDIGYLEEDIPQEKTSFTVNEERLFQEITDRISGSIRDKQVLVDVKNKIQVTVSGNALQRVLIGALWDTVNDYNGREEELANHYQDYMNSISDIVSRMNEQAYLIEQVRADMRQLLDILTVFSPSAEQLAELEMALESGENYY